MSHNNTEWKTDQCLIRITNITIAVYLIYSVSVTSLSGIFGWNASAVVNVCLYGFNPIEKFSASRILTELVPMSMLLIISLSTATMDTACYFKIKSAPNAPQTQIPLKASLLSSFLIIPYLIGMIVLRNIFGFSSVEKYVFMNSIIFFFTLIRNPLILNFTVKVNEVNQQINLEEERERKRQIEIQEAIAKREERRKNRSENRIQIRSTLTMQGTINKL